MKSIFGNTAVQRPPGLAPRKKTSERKGFRAMARSTVPARTRSASDSIDPWISATLGRHGRLAASAVTAPPDRHRAARIFRWHGWEAGREGEASGHGCRGGPPSRVAGLPAPESAAVAAIDPCSQALAAGPFAPRPFSRDPKSWSAATDAVAAGRAFGPTLQRVYCGRPGCQNGNSEIICYRRKVPRCRRIGLGLRPTQ
jgi:hypothetical protein